MPTSLLLTHAEHRQLVAALRVAVMPLQHSSMEGWLHSLVNALSGIVVADSAVLGVAKQNRPAHLASQGFPATLAADIVATGMTDEGANRVEKRGLAVWNQTTIVAGDWQEYWRDPAVNEVYLPNGIADTVGFCVGMPGTQQMGFAMLNAKQYGRDNFGDKGLALMELVLPAFEAGMRASQLREYQGRIGQILDLLGVGVLVCDISGRLLHQNTALTAILREERAAAALREEIARLVVSFCRAAGAPSKLTGDPIHNPASRTVNTSCGRYRLTATYWHDVLQAGYAVGVLVQELGRGALPRETLRNRYGLTEREIDVAALVVQGRRNAEIARILGISIHTAERHVERIFAKLDVQTRAAVGPKLRGDA